MSYMIPDSWLAPIEQRYDEVYGPGAMRRHVAQERTAQDRLLARTSREQFVSLRWLATLVAGLPTPPDAEDWADLQKEARRGLGHDL